MNKELLQQLKQKLERDKVSIENELKTFAKKDPNLKGDWDSLFPKFDKGNIEEAADEVEEYSTRLPVEFSLENKLKDIETALQKIKKGKYGICEECQKPISIERLKVCPSAKTCQNCR